ncbi:uncharacterized protein LOC116181819 [Photinus pyralis]|uniref:uncharacterized protein LOC116181819 n=1 Tax=Photinus pyralis TaxID=7054 RepID=UPI0012671D7D|nr:uncharacterized protein LOC116181819 [Photinus pyralis]
MQRRFPLCLYYSFFVGGGAPYADSGRRRSRVGAPYDGCAHLWIRLLCLCLLQVDSVCNVAIFRRKLIACMQSIMDTYHLNVKYVSLKLVFGTSTTACLLRITNAIPPQALSGLRCAT